MFTLLICNNLHKIGKTYQGISRVEINKNMLFYLLNTEIF